MRVILFFFFIVFSSCVTESNPILDNETPDGGVWICYHPGSPYHGKVCEYKFEPGQCLVSGDLSKFCWLLNFDECNNTHIMYNEVCTQDN